MLPAERGNVGQQVVWDTDALSTKVMYGALQVYAVPMHDGCRQQAQPRRPEALVFESAIADFTLTVKEHGAAQRVACLALVEARMAALPQPGVREPLQGEQRAFDPTNGAERARQGIARAGCSELAQDDGRRDRTRLD